MLFSVYTIEDNLLETDAITMVFIELYEAVKPLLEMKKNVKIIDSCWMIEEVLNNEFTANI